MRTIKLLLAIFAIAVSFAQNGPAQVYQFSEPLSGRLTMSVQDAAGGGSGSFQLNFNSLSESIYLDTVNNTIRQVGTILYTPSTNGIQFTENQNGITGTVTVNLAPTNGYLYFDTGVAPVSWNPASQTYTYGPYGAADVPFFITNVGSYTLNTGGQTLSGSFSYSMNDNQDGNYTAAYTYWQVSLANYPALLELSGLGDCCDNYGGSCFLSPGVVANITAGNGFHLQIEPGINSYWTGGQGELFTWSAPSVAANLVGSGPCPATATAIVTNGFVVGATITDAGCGFTNAPEVLIEGGGGSGATGIAVVSNGIVSSITITDAGSNYTSEPTIYIGTSPNILSSPQSVTVNAHNPATFSVTASGTASMNYQWSLNGTNIPNAASTTLSIPNVVQTNLGTYTVVISNPFGTNSASAVLSMYPFLVTPFTGLQTYWGYTNTLAVNAWGSGPLMYQWFDNGYAIPDATNASLIFDGIQLTNGGLYSVVVSDAYGSVTNTPEQVVVEPSGVSLGTYPGVTISGVVGYNYIIQSTTNLGNTNAWQTVANVTLTNTVQLWVDTNTDTASPGNPQKFYQVLPGQ